MRCIKCSDERGIHLAPPGSKWTGGRPNTVFRKYLRIFSPMGRLSLSQMRDHHHQTVVLLPKPSAGARQKSLIGQKLSVSKRVL